MPDKNAYLKAMGIDVWLEREPANIEISNHEPSPLPVESKNDSRPVELNSLEPVPADISAADKTAIPEQKNNITTLDWSELQYMVSTCTACELSEVRQQVIFGEGNRTASLMIIGDMPTEKDDKQGAIFSGEIGALLTAMLKAMGYQRSDVYIANTIKCCTAQKQEPTEEQAERCEPYLLRQISLLQPKLILAFGSFAANRLLKSKSSMSRLRGQLHYVEGINAPVLVSYHPAYLLQAPNEKRKAWEDLQIAMKELASS